MLDDLDSDDEGATEQTMESLEKRSEMQGWFHFCNDTVDKIEKVWNRKLDQPNAPVSTVADVEKKTENEKADEQEQDTIEVILAKLN